MAKKISPFLPGPLLGLALGLLAAQTFWSDTGLILIKDKFGSIPTDFLFLHCQFFQHPGHHR